MFKKLVMILAVISFGSSCAFAEVDESFELSLVDNYKVPVVVPDFDLPGFKEILVDLNDL